MSRRAWLQSVITNLLATYNEQQYSFGQIVNYFIVDQRKNHFLVITEGWENNTQVHHILIHLIIRENKIHLIKNGTERDLEAELLEQGVQPSEIVPAHLPPSLRHWMDYAAA
jgi:hypothetical protein